MEPDINGSVQKLLVYIVAYRSYIEIELVDLAESNSYPLQQSQVGIFPYLVIAFMPLALLDIRLPLPGIEVRLSDFYLLAMFGYFLLKFEDAFSWTVRTTFAFAPFLIYLLFYAIFTGNRNGLLELIQWGLVLLWVPVLSYVLRDGDDKLIRVLLLSLTLVAVYVAVAHILNGELVRYKSLGDAKYTFGLNGLLACLCLMRFKEFKYWAALSLALLLMGLSLERNGVVIFLATMVFLVPLLKLKVSSSYIAMFFVATKVMVFTSGFLFYFLVLRHNIDVTHFLDEETALWESDLHRSNLIGNGVNIFFDHPWFGVGAKLLRESMAQFYIDGRLALYTHNWYLDMFVEYGSVGVLLFLVGVIPAILNISVKHNLAWALIPLTFYCFTVPVFMANGTTTMLIYLTAVACCLASGWQPGTKTSRRARVP